jgi:hypothetical protein
VLRAKAPATRETANLRETGALLSTSLWAAQRTTTVGLKVARVTGDAATEALFRAERDELRLAVETVEERAIVAIVPRWLWEFRKLSG